MTNFLYIGAITFNWFTDGLDILLVAVLLYQLYKIVKKTNAVNIFSGILAIYILWMLVDSLGMNMLSKTIGQFIDVGVIALIIVFQQEIRKFLVVLGKRGSLFTSDNIILKWLFQKKETDEDKVKINISSITKACFQMSKTFTGAIIVIKQKDSLTLIQETGEPVDAKMSESMLHSIFYKNSPLHDGAILVENNQIVAARCVLPVTEREDFPFELGMRHRAGVGVSEQNDSVVVMVSEQSGSVSIAKNGVLYHNLDENAFLTKLNNLLSRN